MRQIESHEVRGIIGAVFYDLLRLLECLSLLETHLRQIDAAEETFTLFQIINDEARSLVELIQRDGLNCAAMNEDLISTLDGIVFAVTHDLEQVFEKEQPTNHKAPTAHLVVGRLYRAHDLLTNCLQQSTITLAMVFDPELVGTRLFNNSDMRYRQSLQLCEDLVELLQLVEASRMQSDERSFSSLASGIARFKNESLELLMYSDWQQFESFCNGIRAPTSKAQREPVLHQFRCYLETLLGQVRMRTVLTNVLPVRFGADETAQGEQGVAALTVLPASPLDECAESAELAFAV